MGGSGGYLMMCVLRKPDMTTESLHDYMDNMVAQTFGQDICSPILSIKLMLHHYICILICTSNLFVGFGDLY
jgi:hypothetical protein